MRKNQISSVTTPMMPTAFIPAAPVLEALIVLGPAGKLVGEILTYKKAIQALEVEKLRIREQANVMHKQIDAKLALALAQLEAQQKQFEQLNAQYSITLQEQRLNNATLRNAFNAATQKFANPHLKHKERRDLMQLMNTLSFAITECTKTNGYTFSDFCSTIESNLLENKSRVAALASPTHY